MDYQVSLPGCEGHLVEAHSAGLFGGYRLLVDGQPVAKGARRGEMIIRRNDGTEMVARWKPRILGLDVPQLQVGDQSISLVDPLQWYEWIWGGLPVLLVFTGGALGGVLGVLGFSANTRVFRAPVHPALRYLLTGAISVLTVAVFLLVVSLLFGTRESTN